jgi:hypothetical protein
VVLCAASIGSGKDQEEPIKCTAVKCLQQTMDLAEWPDRLRSRVALLREGVVSPCRVCGFSNSGSEFSLAPSSILF